MALPPVETEPVLMSSLPFEAHPARATTIARAQTLLESRNGCLSFSSDLPMMYPRFPFRISGFGWPDILSLK